jgi:SAM-dependent methyltransferase
MATTGFDPVAYKQSTTEQWDAAAEAWSGWGPTLERWLGEATELLLDMTHVGEGSRVLDIAAGAGGQTLAAARRVGPQGVVLATDISPEILRFAARAAEREQLANVATRTVDGEALEVDPGSYDAAISRLGLIYMPDQLLALREQRRALRSGGRVGAIVYSTADRNGFFSIPVGVIRRRAQLPAPAPGQPGPFSLAGDGVLAELLESAGFGEVEVRGLPAPLRMSSAAECLRFERESFGALHQMLAGLGEAEREETWQEIERELAAFEDGESFSAPCELLVAAGTAP